MPKVDGRILFAGGNVLGIGTPRQYEARPFPIVLARLALFAGYVHGDAVISRRGYSGPIGIPP